MIVMSSVGPANLLPSDNLVLTVIVTIVCGIYNFTSLLIGAPALVCATVVIYCACLYAIMGHVSIRQ